MILLALGITDDGKWYCPPGEDFARQFGLYYRLRSSAEINWVYQRNLMIFGRLSSRGISRDQFRG